MPNKQKATDIPIYKRLHRQMWFITLFLFFMTIVLMLFNSPGWLIITLICINFINLVLGQLAVIIEYGKWRNK